MAMVMPGGDRFMALFYPHDPNEWMVDFMEKSRKKINGWLFRGKSHGLEISIWYDMVLRQGFTLRVFAINGIRYSTQISMWWYLIVFDTYYSNGDCGLLVEMDNIIYGLD